MNEPAGEGSENGLRGCTWRMSTENTCPFCVASSRFLLDSPCAVTVCSRAVTARGSTYVFCMAMGLTAEYADLGAVPLAAGEDRYALLLRARVEAKGVSSVLSITPS
jgi:hypothetical protein